MNSQHISIALAAFLFASIGSNAAVIVTSSRYGSIEINDNDQFAGLGSPQALSGSVSYQADRYVTGLSSLFQFAGTGTVGGYATSTFSTTKKGYYEFAITGVTDPVASASVFLHLPVNGFSESADSPTSTQTIGLRLSDFDPDNFQANYPTTSPPTYGDGDLIASALITNADAGTSIEFSFNSAGVAYLNNASGFGITTLKVSTELTDHNYPNTGDTRGIEFKGYVFENTNGLVSGLQPQLSVTPVPEPSSMALLGLGSLTLLLRRRM